MGRLNAEERLKEEASPGAVKFVVFRLLCLFCAIDGPFLNPALKCCTIEGGLVLVGDAKLCAKRKRWRAKR